MKVLAQLAVPAAVLLMSAASLDVRAEVEQLYTPCAACHLADGSGVPGAFPPLRGRVASMAASASGRAYLVHVVNVGLIGPISIAGTPYVGAMPAQGSNYEAAELAELLNYVVLTLDAASAPEDFTRFTTAEVQAILGGEPVTSGQGTAAMRRRLMESQPELR